MAPAIMYTNQMPTGEPTYNLHSLHAHSELMSPLKIRSHLTLGVMKYLTKLHSHEPFQNDSSGFSKL